MQTQNHSVKFLKKRKFLSALPLLIIPFLTMAFWALGGGKGSNDANKISSKQQGINLQLPTAKIKDDPALDKLSFYNKAEKDSLAFEDAVKNDSYYRKYITQNGEEESISDDGDTDGDDTPDITTRQKYQPGLNTSPKHNNIYADPNEEKVRKKLAQLKSVIEETPASNTRIYKPYSDNRSAINRDEFTTQVDKLEGMMQALNQTGEADPEMKQLENMMDKIMDLQNPERVKERIKEQSKEKDKSLYSVSAMAKRNNISLLQSADDTMPAINCDYAFLSLDAGDNFLPDTGNALHAIIHETQTLVNGSVVKLRLMQDAYINGIKIPNGNFIYGTVSLNNERLMVQINSIRNNQSIYAVKMKVYDLDGLEGIYISGAIGSELVKQSSDNALQNMGMMSVDPSLAEQVASAGISAAKTIFSKKVKFVKATVKAGYQVLLKN